MCLPKIATYLGNIEYSNKIQLREQKLTANILQKVNAYLN